MKKGVGQIWANWHRGRYVTKYVTFKCLGTGKTGVSKLVRKFPSFPGTGAGNVN